MLAAPPSDWDVMAIFIPADPDQQRQFIPRIYVPIEIEDLEVKLAEEQARRREALFDSVTLREATYVARIDGDLMISELSRWKFRGTPSRQTITLSPVSIAMRDARAIDSQRLEQLSTYQRFTATGAIELSFNEESAERWFGFSKLATATDVGPKFEFQLPLAPIAKLLVSIPKNYVLDSPDVIVESIDDHATELPSDWPNRLQGPAVLNTGRTWWCVNASGRSNFALEMHAVKDSKALLFQHTLRNCDIDYSIGDLHMDVASKFVIASSSIDSPLRFRLAADLRVKRVTMDGSSATWRAIASETQEHTVIEVVDYLWNGRETTVEVTASGNVDDPATVRLPQLSVENSYAITGTTRVQGSEGKSINNVEAASVEFVPAKAASDLSNQLLSWTGNWMGVAPTATASYSVKDSRWQYRGLTRFNVQAAWLAASARIRLKSENLISNEVRLQVSEDWFVDSLKLIGNSDNDVRAQFIEQGIGQDRRTEIVINWEQFRDNIELEVDITAHSPRETDAEKLHLGNPRLISLPDSDQEVIYVVESAGRFRIHASAELLRFQLTPKDLPDWQQAMLPQLSNAWIFSDNLDEPPAIELVASGGTYATSTYTLVLDDSRRKELTYRITCRPISGNIDRLRVTYPHETNLDDLKFELIQPNDESALPVSFETISSIDDGSDRELEIILPVATDTPFEIRGVSKSISPSEPIRIAVPGFPTAVSSDSTIILPRRLASFVGSPPLDLLPATSCCSGDETRFFETELQDHSPATYVAARLEASNCQLLELRPTVGAKHSGWLWSELVEHRLWDDGSCEHRILWDLEVGELSLLEFDLPVDWRIEQIFIDGVTIDEELGLKLIEGTLNNDQSRTLSLVVPTHRRSKIVVECASRLDARIQSIPVIAHVDFAKPMIGDLAVFESKQRIFIAPSMVALSSIPRFQISQKLSDRLLPKHWWSLVAPRSMFAIESAEPSLSGSLTEPTVAFRSSSGLAPERGWSLVEYDPDSAKEPAAIAPSVSIWLINRSALAGLTMSALLVVSSLFWILLGKAVRLWWLAIAILSIAVILVPRDYLPYAQLLLLACVLAALGRLVQVVAKVHRQRGHGESRQFARISTLGKQSLLLCLLVGQVDGVFGQTTSAGSLETTRSIDDRNEQQEPTKIFGVLFPTDENANVSGKYAYVPTELWKLLTAPDIATTQVGPPHILSAEYLLRVRPGSSNAELTADFQVQVTETNSELRLPFRAGELSLASGQVNGEEVLIGLQSLLQNANEVVFLSNKVGTFNVSLQFVTSTTVRSDRVQFQATIPPIPNAMMRIEAEGLNVDVNALGGIQRVATGELLASLGPVDRLNVAWTELARRDPSTPLELVSETWVRGRGEQVVAACRLRYSLNQGLPKTLHVYIDSEWEPVGTSWGDVELTNETMTFGNRRVYTVRMREMEPRSSQEVNVAVLLVPRSLKSEPAIALPFMSLQEVSPTVTRRVLLWSAESASVWKPDGADFWPESTGETGQWGTLALSETKRIYRVPAGTGPLQLRRQTERQTTTVDETTAVHYTLTEEVMDYSATWNGAGATPSVVRVKIPLTAQVSSTRINGRAVQYWLSEHEDSQLLLIPLVSQDIDQINSLDIKVTRPVQANTPLTLSRVVLQDANIRNSSLRLFRDAMVDLRLDHHDDGQLASYQLAVTSIPVIDSLEVLVAEFELAQRYRTTALPVAVEMSRREATGDPAFVMQLQNNAGGWIAQVKTIWPAGAELDFAFYDIPFAVRDSLFADNLARKYLPTADASRTTLCMIPRILPSGEREATFAFPLPVGVTGQSLPIPQVRLLANEPLAPVVGLPKMIDGQPIAWQTTGQKYKDETTLFTSDSTAESLDYFLLPEMQTQIAWQPPESQSLPARIENVNLEISSNSSKYVAAKLNYWVTPRGQLELEFRLPENCEVLGVEVSGIAALWNRTGQLLEVSLQPNYLPVNAVLLLRWEFQGADHDVSIELPQPLIDQVRDEIIISVSPDSFQHRRIRTRSAMAELPANELLDRWVKLIVATLQSQSGLRPEEIRTWLASWEPKKFGFTPEMSVAPELLEGIKRDFDDNRDGSIALTEFWYGLLAAPESNTPIADYNAAEWNATPQQRTFAITGNRITFAPTPSHERWMPRALAAILLAFVAVLVLAVAQRVKSYYFEVLSLQPWLYWLQIAVLAWLLLPALWPSWVVGGIAMAMAIGQVATRRK